MTKKVSFGFWSSTKDKKKTRFHLNLWLRNRRPGEDPEVPDALDRQFKSWLWPSTAEMTPAASGSHRGVK